MRGQRAHSEFPSIENLFIYFSGVGGKHRARVIRAINYHSYRLLPFPPFGKRDQMCFSPG